MIIRAYQSDDMIIFIRLRDKNYAKRYNLKRLVLSVYFKHNVNFLIDGLLYANINSNKLVNHRLYDSEFISCLFRMFFDKKFIKIPQRFLKNIKNHYID